MRKRLVSGSSLESRLSFGSNTFFDEFDANHGSIIAMTRTEFDDTGVTAGAISIAFCNIIKEFIEE